MRRLRMIAVAGATSLAIATAAAGMPSASANGVAKVHAECSTPQAGHAQCFALRVIAPTEPTTGTQPLARTAGPSGLHPGDLRNAYGLTAAGGIGHTIAIVDAYDDPKAEEDLAVYRAEFGLAACTTANGCFMKVGQTGTKVYPKADPGWAAEISLDLDMVSAICPKCHILLVEARTSSFSDLAASVDQAVALGAAEISNSYGGAEFASEKSLASSYDHPGIPITVSTGDGAYAAGPQMPAAFSTVTAVGGTTLTAASTGRGWNEAAWSTSATFGAGGGCSLYVAKPAWQKDKGCAHRTITDVSVVGDPATGVSAYDTYKNGGWLVLGGTSASAPIVAGIYALATGLGASARINDASYLYAHRGFWDVKKGSTGTCRGSYLCNARTGYDGPTGLGTPRGTRAF